MSDAAVLDHAPIVVTANAARRIGEILKDEPPGSMLRIAVSGGGCSGFQYGFTIDQTRNDDDFVVERDGVTVLVDSVSLEYMKDSEIDFVEDLIGASFQIRNPNATSKCGCGSSFAI
jgi:iron-sulfur cluster assembly accessory protein